MGTDTEGLVGKKVVIKWRFWRGKPELDRYQCFTIRAIMNGWMRAQPYYSLAQIINDEPPVWIPMSDIRWMAEIEPVS